MAGIVARIVLGAVMFGLTTGELRGELKNAEYNKDTGKLTYKGDDGITHTITKYKMMKSSEMPSPDKIIIMKHNQRTQTVEIAYVSQKNFSQMANQCKNDTAHGNSILYLTKQGDFNPNDPKSILITGGGINNNGEITGRSGTINNNIFDGYHNSKQNREASQAEKDVMCEITEKCKNGEKAGSLGKNTNDGANNNNNTINNEKVVDNGSGSGTLGLAACVKATGVIVGGIVAAALGSFCGYKSVSKYGQKRKWTRKTQESAENGAAIGAGTACVVGAVGGAAVVAKTGVAATVTAIAGASGATIAAGIAVCFAVPFACALIGGGIGYLFS